MINALVIIPAKTDSTRLKGKNLRKVLDRSLVEYAIQYARECELVSSIIVTTESAEVRGLASRYPDVRVYDRDPDFMGEREVADVYVNVVQNDLKKYNDEGLLANVTHVVGVQPDHPDRSVPLSQLLRYAVDNKYDDLVTTNANGTRNGAVRIVKVELAVSGSMSRRVGSHLESCTNVHCEADLLLAEKNILKGLEIKGCE